MVKVLCGKKGTGKSKLIVETANSVLTTSKGDIVFIDDSKQSIYGLNRKIRLIDASDFPVTCANCFIGFICGLVVGNFDTEAIFIDGLNFIIGENNEDLEIFIKALKNLSEKYGIDFYAAMNGDPSQMPEFLKEVYVDKF